ncbi:hypothetical protein DPMN_189352 [Dreissena polymorpha]|uniref:Uncharacterized protein n=1 Tax=Dreissena polymorpha TaxID=45954 RepID=A0A9D4DSM5_DREPO|nr:hypothetical protein DPMN_189352 [Dreissena polymorpha]
MTLDWIFVYKRLLLHKKFHKSNKLTAHANLRRHFTTKTRLNQHQTFSYSQYMTYCLLQSKVCSDLMILSIIIIISYTQPQPIYQRGVEDMMSALHGHMLDPHYDSLLSISPNNIKYWFYQKNGLERFN